MSGDLSGVAAAFESALLLVTPPWDMGTTIAFVCHVMSPQEKKSVSQQTPLSQV